MKNVIRVNDFGRDVLERSHGVPVVVDFWAEWCAPCRVLGPVLERLADESGSRWMLATVNTEEHPEDAARYGVRSIPSVKLFIDGSVAGEFTGALPEYAVRQWLDKVIPGPSAGALEAARAMIAAGDREGAGKILRPVVDQERENAEARVLLAGAIVLDDPQEAVRLTEGIEDPLHSDGIETVTTIARMHTLKQDAGELPPSAVREMYLTAIGKFFDGKYDGALSDFIEIIRRERGYDDDGSRKACLAIFRLLGEEHEITLRHRREFGSALYI